MQTTQTPPEVPTSTSTTPTIESLVRGLRIRKGEADGTTKRGAFWLVRGPRADDGRLEIRSTGGDGIGQSGASIHVRLQIRHYRTGEVSMMVEVSSWHQNSGTDREYYPLPAVQATSAEDVVVALKGLRMGDWDLSPYHDSYEQKLVAYLAAIGLPSAPASPDGE